MSAIARASLAVLLTLLTTACATQVTLPPLPDGHPARAKTPTAELPAPSALLDQAAPIPAKHAADPEAATVYTCPMHPEVRSDTPGACPICGMALEPVTPTESQPEENEEEQGHGHGGHP